MALKGTAIIELTNVKTGEKERYVEHNLVTNALAQLHAPIGDLKKPRDLVAYNDNDHYVQQYEPVYPYLLGGLVLWADPIEEDANIVMQPPGNSMIGCAAYGKTNTTTSPNRGSFNATESYFTNSSVERSMKFVYDFQTNQANGTINALSLTGYQGGFNGFGGNNSANDFCEQFGFRDNNWPYLDTPYGLDSVGGSTNLLYIDPDEDVFYLRSTITTSTVLIKKCRANIHSRSMFRNSFSTHDTLETITVQLPTTLAKVGSSMTCCDLDHNVCYILVNTSTNYSYVATSGAFSVIAIDMTTWTATVTALTNKLSQTLYLDRNYTTCCDGYIYTCSSTYLRRISMADGSYTSAYNPTGKSPSSYSYPIAWGGLIYYYVGYASGSSTSNVVAVYDPVSSKVRVTGLFAHLFGRTPIKGHPLIRYYALTGSLNSKNYYYGRLVANPLYLATINNLARPIEKTSEKTMKITYTIQEI